MCGIVGYVGTRQAGEILLDGLKRLEYRGYDSSGLAVLNQGKIELRRAVGKLSNLQSRLKHAPMKGEVGLGHTRWATHGVPSEENAHPHTDCTSKIVVVHNGIIENYAEIKERLLRKKHRFASQTDTEVVAHLIEEEWSSVRKKNVKPDSAESRKAFQDTVRRSLKQLKGAYALGVLCSEFPGLLIAARKDCPLVIGLGTGENFIASDVPALIPYTRRTLFLGQGEIAALDRDSAECSDLDGNKIKREVVNVSWDPIQAEKSGHKHYMLKEMMEQPTAIEDTLRGRLFSYPNSLRTDLSIKESFIRNLERIVLVACGTSYHSALVGRFWLEQLARVPCDVEIASEYRYRQPFLNPRELAVFISQSGETADTLAALRMVQKAGARTLAICNVLGSTITTEADSTFYTHCGPEIGVASTKAFVGQLTALSILALYFAAVRKTTPERELINFRQDFLKVPGWVRDSLKLSDAILSIGRKFCKRSHFLFLGRHLNYPIALEGALKLKEISYIHAEGYPAGEMKHGPIALIDKNMPIVAIATNSGVYDKICSNIQEAKARGGTVVALATRGNKEIARLADEVIWMPATPEIFSPIVNTVPLQLLAYHIAVLRGCDVDQPRNLAKSVTVE